MPIPTPETGESQDDFISRCMGNDTMKEDYPENDQRLAVCYSSWRDKHGGEPPSDKDWFSIRAQENDPVEVLLYGAIGGGMFSDGIGAKDFIDSIKALKLKAKDSLILRINSPGGDVFDAVTIYNYLRSIKRKVTARIDALAASAASVVAMAGSKIYMPRNSFMFIHKPQGMTMGNADDHREMADMLDTVETGMMDPYLRHAGKKLDAETLTGMLRDNTWLTAEEALKHGLADEIDEPVKAAAFAHLNLTAYGYPHVPDELQRQVPDFSDQKAKLESLKVNYS